jgi:penicillin-binding protein activator
LTARQNQCYEQKMAGLLRISYFSFLAGTLFVAGCARTTAVRDTDVEGLDDAAMSTGLDRSDLQRMLKDNMNALNASTAVARWHAESRPTVAVLGIKNETSEHIESALDALISDVETELVNAGHVRVISTEEQPELMARVRSQQEDGFDQTKVASWGQQVGARYFVTGKVYTVDERQSGERRVQYFLFMRVLEAATGDLLWQNKASVTKALVKK